MCVVGHVYGGLCGGRDGGGRSENDMFQRPKE